MVNKITHFSDIAIEINENQYAQTLLMSQLKSNFLVDSVNVGVISEGIQTSNKITSLNFLNI